MKSQKGVTLIKLVIAVIVLIIVMFFFVILLKLGIIRFGKKDGGTIEIKTESREEKTERNPNHTDSVTFITSNESNYVFIDDAGMVVKIPRNIMANKNITEGERFFNDSILVEDENIYKVIDFNGNTIFEADEPINTLINTKDKTIFGFNKEGKYGVIDSNGKIVVELLYNEPMETIKGIDYFYTYGYNYDSKGEKYLITIFNKNGEKVYETDSYINTLEEAKTCKTLNGINVALIQKNKKTIEIVNLNAGELIQTVDLKNKTEVEIREEANVLLVDKFQRAKNNKKLEEQKFYYWFGKDEKISRNVRFEQNSGEAYVDSVKYFVLLKEGNKNTITDKYGKDIYVTTNPIYMVEYQAREGSEVYPFLLEQLDKKQYKIMDHTGKAILYERLDKAGNKYLQVGSTLYTHDGVKSMVGVSEFFSIYDLDIIVTQGKMYIENADGRVVEKAGDYNLENLKGLIDDNTAIFGNGSDLVAIDIRNLTVKTIDLGSYYNITVHDGFITATDKEKTNYYDRDGKLIYQIYE